MMRLSFHRLPWPRSLLHALAIAVLVSFFGSSAGMTAASDGKHPAAPTAPTAACPSAKALQPLLDLGSVYLGETHGTNEVPALVGCLVDSTLASGVSPLTVSLELPTFARDTKSAVWAGQDGRTSKAMEALVEHLEALEKAGRITLDFQLTGNERSDDAMNRHVGIHLRSLASTKGRVIALGGNIHSQRKQVLLPSLHVKPAGAYLGDAIKTVFINAGGDGYAWNCSPACGEHRASGSTDAGHIGQLMDGKAVGHDYIYKTRPFTASHPAIERLPGTRN